MDRAPIQRESKSNKKKKTNPCPPGGRKCNSTVELKCNFENGKLCNHPRSVST